ncbi:MAG TPA: hypothetical protein VM433_04830 [Mycobacteriales bacterium]|nr:hypothetical protein [Mycobacteriales bacterium]
MSTPTRRPSALRALLAVASLSLVAAGTGAVAAQRSPAPDDSTPARTVPFALVEGRDVDDRRSTPEDRYAMAGGCYTVEAPGQGFVARDGGGLVLVPDAAAALPLHFQATRLGEYLLATNEGPDTRYEGAWWDVRGYLSGGSALPAPLPGALPSSDVVVADGPSVEAEWRVEVAEAGPKGRGPARSFSFALPARDAVLTVQDGTLALAPAAGAEATPLALRHVPDDDPADDPNGAACATWPEVDTGASGAPQPVAESAASEARGFFEAHVHGMAFEFLGGELRCGRPWHEYGVEFALGGCDQEGKPLNRFLEVPLGGMPASDPVAEYDPVGWPTFSYWPQPRTLTHEQFYWRWLERAHAGGLRLLTNLLVDNTALCQLYPQKKNSCNEMDGVRLQAQRLFELQDYVDAQAGGPGEGWFRIVTSPAQARQVVNAGRLAVVLGIEVSELFDCREVLDQPQCTTEQIDERLQEVFDMGVRQMELVNKFDNALTGVTGDGGTTGPVVNTGNRYVTGHFWDMRSCEPDGHTHQHGVDGDEHDKTQPVPTDATPGDGEGVDALAGRVLDQFGGITRGFVAPVYGPGPHCNARGLTELGRHLIARMVEKGMIFDPDHMSASAQREAMDLIEGPLWAAEQQRAAEQGRPARRPAVISSHSWANDVIYQRIYRADGLVAPRTDDAASFVRAWAEHRDFAARNAPAGHTFGLGYGADTNGLGGQPGPRREAATRVDYAAGWQAPIGGVRLSQHTSGLRTFDVNTEGVSHYGLFADWFHELSLAADELAPERGGGAAILDDMLGGAEAYLQLWERAVYGGGECVRDGSTLQQEDLHAALGLELERFLAAVGQPVDRDGAAYRYCVEDDDGELQHLDVAFDAAGTAVDAAPAGPTTTSPTEDAAAGVDVDDHDHAAHDHAAVDATGSGEVRAATDAGDRSLSAALTSSPAGVGVSALLLLAVVLLGVQVAVDRRRTQQHARR